LTTAAPLRVLELSDREEAAAYCGKLFRRWGADVVRVETPGHRAQPHLDIYLNGGKKRRGLDPASAGDREAIVRFGHIRLGPRLPAPSPFALALAVPGRARIPGGPTLESRAAGGPARSGPDRAVVAVPIEAEPLLLRTRRPGDRVFLRGRSMSLKRFLMESHIPVDARAGLPLVASGPAVLFVPGLPVESPPGGRFVRLEVLG